MARAQEPTNEGGPIAPRGATRDFEYAGPAIVTSYGVEGASGNSGTGGGGGGRPNTSVGQPTTTPKPVKPIPPAVQFVPEPPPPPQVAPNIRVPDAKVPQPTLPDTTRLAGRVPVTTNPNRYGIAGGEWSITAKGVGANPKIVPLRFRFGTRPELIPLLRVNGIAVEVEGRYLVSPQTLADIRNSRNPHYDIVQNGTLLKTAMGKSVPVIRLDVEKLRQSGVKRDVENAKAGVRSVDYIYETPTVYGIPEGIINQINATLDPNTERPADSFQVWNMKLKGDYSTNKLKTYPLTTDGKLDKPKVKILNDLIFGRMNNFHADVNMIKGLYFKGLLPVENRNGSVPYTRLARVVDGELETVTNYVTRVLTPVPILTSTKAEVKELAAQAAGTTGGVKAGINPKTGAPTDTKAVKTTGDESAALLNRWRGYGFTTSEAAEIRRYAKAGGAPFIRVADGTVVGIGSARFGPDLCRKARIVLPLNSEDRRLWEEFYGIGLSDKEYSDANQLRIADLLHLANLVEGLELKSGKNYQRE